jgi:ketosteroid isomerase-like protein
VRDTRDAIARENVEQVLQGYAAINDGDVDGVAEGLGPEFELNLPPILPDAESYRGPDGFKRAIHAWRESFDDFRIEIEEVIDAGDEVVVMASVQGVGKDSGAPVKSPSFPHVWTFENGRPVSMRALPNRAAAIDALGLAD